MLEQRTKLRRLRWLERNRIAPSAHGSDDFGCRFTGDEGTGQARTMTLPKALYDVEPTFAVGERQVAQHYVGAQVARPLERLIAAARSDDATPPLPEQSLDRVLH